MHTLEQLASFIAVFETGSYSAAAQKLGKSRATVREQVVSYEENLGFALYEVIGKKLIPTDRAKALYPRAQLITRQNDELLSYSRAFFDHQLTNLTVYHDTTVPAAMLVYLEQRLRERFAHISVNWLHRNRDEAFRGLMAEQAQLALLQNRSSIYPEQELGFIRLGNLPMSAYVGCNSPLLEKQPPPRQEFQLYTQYVFENDANAESYYAKISPRTHQVSNPDMLCNLIAQDGWGLLPDVIAAPFVRLGLLKKLAIDKVVKPPYASLSLFYPHGVEGLEPVNYLMACCREFAEQHFA